MVNNFLSGTVGLGRIQSKTDNLSLALNRLNSVAFAELRLANENMLAAVIDLRAQPGQTNRPISTFFVASDMPITTIALTLKVRLPDLIVMNPRYAREPLIRAGTRLQYQTNVA
jgi:hypothetical protein